MGLHFLRWGDLDQFYQVTKMIEYEAKMIHKAVENMDGFLIYSKWTWMFIKIEMYMWDVWKMFLHWWNCIKYYKPLF